MLVLARLLAIAFIVAFSASGSLAQLAEKRVALVIGNASYAAVPPLANPSRDAESMASVLRKTGFTTVVARTDLTREAFLTELRDFSALAAQSDWAVVYFAGHGIEVNGVNYLIPVDARLLSDRDIAFEAIALDQLLRAVDGARKLRLIILDACRDNPFAARLIRSISSRQISRGLARVEPDGGTLVAYAARDGQVALDGADGNSPFVSSILRHIETPGLEVNKLFRLVRNDVLISSQNRQEPFVYGALPPDDFFFVMPVSGQDGTPLHVSPAAPSAAGSTPVPKQPEQGGAPAPSSAVASHTAPADFVSQIQGELRRLGCYEGNIDGAWDGPATRKARQSLSRMTGLAATDPGADLLDSLRQQTRRVCPPTCKANETIQDGQCIAKTCRPGEVLNRAGACVKPPVAKVQPRQQQKQQQSAQEQTTRSSGSTPSNCFVFDGRRYCE